LKNRLLADDIKQFQDEQMPSIPEATLNTLMSELQGLINAGIAEKSISVNTTFPDFTLSNVENEPCSLNSLLSESPLVISFYRSA
jgi:hypothetical protein